MAIDGPIDRQTEFYIQHIIGRRPEQASQPTAAHQKGTSRMAETRTRPARERERFALLITAEQWFWKKMVALDEPAWERAQEWGGFHSSLKIRRLMAAVKSDDPTAVHLLACSSAAIAQGRLSDIDADAKVSGLATGVQ